MKGKIVPADLFDEVQRLRDEYRTQHPATGAGQRAITGVATGARQ